MAKIKCSQKKKNHTTVPRKLLTHGHDKSTQ